MDSSACASHYINKCLPQKIPLLSKAHEKIERMILKLYLIDELNRAFYDFFCEKIQSHQDVTSMEHYFMDKKIIQFLITDIIATGEYTLEGIAYATHIPLDIIFDAACGINKQLSITPWTRIANLYLQVKPEIRKYLIDKLLELQKKIMLHFPHC